MLNPGLLQHLEKCLSDFQGTNVNIQHHSPIAGGCINDAQKLDTTSGTFFVKSNDSAKYPGMLEAEAKGLAMLASTNTISVPQVICMGAHSGSSYLVEEFIVPGRRKKNFWENFGEQLARLHQNTATTFGLDHDNYIGSLLQINQQHPKWEDFFIRERLERQFQLAKKGGKINSDLNNERLYEIVKMRIPHEPPALLHGDLWNGNFLTGADGAACLIDPAVYFGHREMDLAMTKLFGGFPEEFYHAYHSTYPLEPGFEDRVDLHNLYPLLVHVNLFGGGYIEQVNQILKQI